VDGNRLIGASRIQDDTRYAGPAGEGSEAICDMNPNSLDRMASFYGRRMITAPDFDGSRGINDWLA